MRRESLAARLLLTATVLAGLAAPPRAGAQVRPRLGLTFYAGQPTLSLTGSVGTVYCIQYATNLSRTNNWTDRTLVKAQAGGTVWSDPDSPMPSQRFYRAVSVRAPVDSNFVFIQPGTFTMGSPTNELERDGNEIQHVVTISRGFWIGKYLVTQGDYLALMGSNPSYYNGVRYGIDYGTNLTRPVEQVSSFDASNYCAWRTRLERGQGLIPTNYVYRLPTESEWEYAARAGTTNAFYRGSGLYSAQANFDGRYEYEAAVGEFYSPTGGIFLDLTTAVGSYAANTWGLYDMIGNVLEWCQDWYDVYPTGPVTDPLGPVSGLYRVSRGGSLAYGALSCRSANRWYDDPGVMNSFVGFRVVLAPNQL